MTNIHFIINPISGTVSKSKIPIFVAQQFLADRYKTHIHYTERAGHASELALKAIAEGAHTIVAVGGDGTVNEIARAMVHSEASLGIIPCGSGNGLARDLGIPIDIKKAIDIVIQRNETYIDYCKANNHIFFCTCGFGFDAIISERFANEKQRGSIAYIKSVIAEYMKFNSDDYELIIDGKHIKEKAFLVTCANAAQYGNNAFIAPQANIRDGKMDVVIISPINALEAAPFAVQLFTKQIHHNNKSQIYQAKKVTVIRKCPGVMHVDGDPINVNERIDVEVIPEGLKVIVPRDEQIQTIIQVQIRDFRSFLRESTLWIARIGLHH